MPTQNTPPGKIIILNGTSSSGKTSLLKALQQILPGPYLNAGIDKFIWMLPSRYLDRPLWDDVLGQATHAGEVGRRLFSGMHQAIAALSLSGNHVIADHVLVEQGWVTECSKLFHKLPAYLIGVRCPLEVLEQREQGRKDRTLGQARAQFHLVHQHQLYDFEVDTAIDTVEQCSQRIKSWLDSNPKPEAFQHLYELLN